MKLVLQLKLLRSITLRLHIVPTDLYLTVIIVVVMVVNFLFDASSIIM